MLTLNAPTVCSLLVRYGPMQKTKSKRAFLQRLMQFSFINISTAYEVDWINNVSSSHGWTKKTISVLTIWQPDDLFFPPVVIRGTATRSHWLHPDMSSNDVQDHSDWQKIMWVMVESDTSVFFFGRGVGQLHSEQLHLNKWAPMKDSGSLVSTHHVLSMQCLQLHEEKNCQRNEVF